MNQLEIVSTDKLSLKSFLVDAIQSRYLIKFCRLKITNLRINLRLFCKTCKYLLSRLQIPAITSS